MAHRSVASLMQNGRQSRGPKVLPTIGETASAGGNGVRSRRGLSASKSGKSSRRQQLIMQKSFRSNARIQSQSLGVKRKPRCRNFRWWHAIFLFSLVSLVFITLQLLLPPPFGMRMTSEEVAEIGIVDGCEDGLERCICPRETICATDTASMVLLVLAKGAIVFGYPLYMMLFLSKAHNLNNVLRRTVLREWIDFADMHLVHSVFGVITGVLIAIHSVLHLIRWALDKDMMGVWESTTFITGMVAAICTVLIVLPMGMQSLKTWSYELRKGLHYLSWVWALSLLWHAPYRIAYLIGIPALVYLVDYLVGMFVRNLLIDNVYFERYGEKGVALHFSNPKGYDCSKTSYVYVMCPWISKWQWHAFSVFPEPSRKDHTMLCIGVNGDWTQEMHDRVTAPCLRSVYVLGPFRSEFSDKAGNTTNALAIASGIGITPTLSLVLNYAGQKRVNIIWMCRDPGLVEYFLHKVDIEAVTKNAFAFIFYTGKRDLVLPKHLPLNIFIFRSRPKLEETISGIVSAIETGEGLPEEMCK